MSTTVGVQRLGGKVVKIASYSNLNSSPRQPPKKAPPKKPRQGKAKGAKGMPDNALALVQPGPTAQSQDNQVSSTTSSGRVCTATPDETLQGLLSTLQCPICDDIFYTPVATCENGHLTCATCVMNLKRCGVCGGGIRARRNTVIEAQLALIEVHCSSQFCHLVVRADKIHDHEENICEFRPIRCGFRLPNGLQCSQSVCFEFYLQHLIQFHKVRNFIGWEDTGTYPCAYSVDALTLTGVYNSNMPTGVFGTVWPMPCIIDNKVFLLNSYISTRNFQFWVSALFPESGCADVYATISMVARHINICMPHVNEDHRPVHQWRVNVHNVHVSRADFAMAGDLVDIPYSILQEYMTVCYSHNPTGDFKWKLVCRIQKKENEVALLSSKIEVPEAHQKEPQKEPEKDEYDFGDLIIDIPGE